MLDYIHSYLLSHKDFIETFAYLATVFAFLVPLPAFVITASIKVYSEKRDRAFGLLDRMNTNDSTNLRNQVSKIFAENEQFGACEFEKLKFEDAMVLHAYLNENELIALQLNTSRVERRLFYRYWRSEYIGDWNKISKYIYWLRKFLNNDKIANEWELAAKAAKKAK
ncbi:DUF4760 domain-containing protein [Roseibium salinum]|uniref:DUF4760 domain-containing protein n=1 Tax=Roseibium salinum TaxID=1604349 RepID=A0ABT3R102_9HYPH|nr:DUF4760 domain-containing protein [Roseibium sp. DSM 29163]MCX2722632.1 DUF4760 domain-containing protein [Roseibium sp. DSM 29163]